MNKYSIAGLIVIAIIAIGGYAVSKQSSQPSEVVGAAAGPDVTESMYLRGGATIGSGCFSTSTSGTLTASMLEKNSCIRIAATGAGQAVISLTLPASTTVQSILPSVGACRAWWIDAGAVAAATTTTVVAGTGIDLLGLDATGAGAGADVIDGAEQGRLTMCRKSTGDVAAFVEEWIAAD